MTNRHMLKTGFALALFLLLLSSAWGAMVGVPKLSSRVTDLTGTLGAEQISALESKLAAFEARKGSQIAVLMLPTTQPEDIAEYGIKVADLWQVGRNSTDDGLIIIIAKDDRRLRLEVGYGLEGVIPDAVAKRIISETMTPFFQKGDYAGGINAGIDQIIGLIDGEALPPPKTETVRIQNEGLFMMILFGGIVIGAVLSAIVGRVPAGMMAGIGSATVAALLLGFSIAVIFVGLMVFFMVGVRHRGGGWTSGGGFGGGMGGGSWSGGGGRFGGGGASGSW